VLGPGPWLIARSPPKDVGDGIVKATLDAGSMAPFRDALAAWLDMRTTDTVLVRPDRYVFGTGAADELVKHWRNLAHL